MNSKTPNFDKALDEILNNLKPHKKICSQCETSFEIAEEDIEFYHKLRVPPPKLCFYCRFQKRYGYRINFLPVFYKRKCDVPGHNEKIISFYSKENKVKVYDDKYYYSYDWDATYFSQDYDFDKGFFEQFKKLSNNVPNQSLQKDLNSVNSEYVVSGVSSKNCYYTAIPYYSENIQYSSFPIRSRDCLNVFWVDSSELCYEGINLKNCYNCDYSSYSSNCIDSYFLFDCRNLNNCFGCFNLRNKSYCFFNKQLTKDEYFKKIKEINLGKRSIVEKYKKEFKKALLSLSIVKSVDNVKTENCEGDNLKNCKNCFYSFNIIDGENLRYTAISDKSSYSVDSAGSYTSFSYELAGGANCNNVKFCSLLRNVSDSEYSIELKNCQYCFGCFGLRDKKYCIFNKQYSEKEYFIALDKIKTQMLKNSEYGDFFPLKQSNIPYNDSNAQIEFPLTKKDVLEKGWNWQDDIESDLDLSKLYVIDAKEVPDDIADIDENILEKAIICEKTKKPFNITQFEFDFYKRKNIPLPIIHPFERVKNLVMQKNPFRLWNRECMCAGIYSDNNSRKNETEHFHKNNHCPNVFKTVYNPKIKRIVYCEECYKSEII